MVASILPRRIQCNLFLSRNKIHTGETARCFNKHKKEAWEPECGQERRETKEISKRQGTAGEPQITNIKSLQQGK